MTRAERVGRRIGHAIHNHRRIWAVIFLLFFVMLIGGFIWHIVSRIQQGKVTSLIGSLIAMIIFFAMQWRKAANGRNG